jgi:hypothetical protein
MKQDDILINCDRYKVVDTVTGEQMPLEVIVGKVNAKGWQKVYADRLSTLLKCGGKVSKVIAHFVCNNRGNEIKGTHKTLAAEIGVSERTVHTAIKGMLKAGVIKQPYPSVYMIDPTAIRYGSAGAGVALITLWNGI